MLMIRLSRQGKRNDPFYRVVVIDKTKKGKGQSLKTIGSWFPAKNKKTIDKKEVLYWISKGAGVSTAVKKLFE